ncbi:hypothetical protein T492DRAFT_837527 [Pavlovales sp. CCMP2436]|nr:hypothetical protein T492DRAFT_837527 [Pavlovales sp. CCMP2436]
MADTSAPSLGSLRLWPAAAPARTRAHAKLARTTPMVPRSISTSRPLVAMMTESVASLSPTHRLYATTGIRPYITHPRIIAHVVQMSTADVVIVGVPLSELGGPPSPPPPAPPRPGKGDKGDEGLWRWVQALTARTLTNAGKLDPNVVLIVRPHRRHRASTGQCLPVPLGALTY